MKLQSIDISHDWSNDGEWTTRPVKGRVTFEVPEPGYGRYTVDLTPENLAEVVGLAVNLAIKQSETPVDIAAFIAGTREPTPEEPLPLSIDTDNIVAIDD